jgi:hypothetical protein
MQIWDMQGIRAAITVCNTCTLTFRHIVLANDNPDAGAELATVIGEAPARNHWAVVGTFDCARKRVACVPSIFSLASYKNSGTTAFYSIPGSKNAQRAAAVQDFTFRGCLYPQSLHVNSANSRISHTYVHAWKQYSGGYDMVGGPGNCDMVLACHDMLSNFGGSVVAAM